MSRFWRILFDSRVLAMIGLAGLVGFIFLGAEAMQLAFIYAGIGLAVLVLLWCVVWLVKRYLAYRKAAALEKAMDEKSEEAVRQAAPAEAGEQQVLRSRMQEAIKTIKTSRLGQTTGRAALYELPWYMIIGNPAAGKSTAILQSGLNFPFADGKGSVVSGIGGTRNCDWFFSTEGILIDTAGRYSVHKEDAAEWKEFLELLKKHRPKAPVNGILIAVSVAELLKNNADNNTKLAKNLRQRIQEVSETLEVFAPVYVIFTKMDLVSGFTEFFRDMDEVERNQVWGATLPYKPEVHADAIAAFDEHYMLLRDGLREQLLAHMSVNRNKSIDPLVMTFPLEFASIKPVLKDFIATLFEENPYQFQPVFRGFYFTSSVQEGLVSSAASDAAAREFDLVRNAGDRQAAGGGQTQTGFFLKDLFSRVIFVDKNLVKQHANKRKNRLRLATFGLTSVLLAMLLAGWAASYIGNRQLMQSVQADLKQIQAVQEGKVDVASRMEAMDLLQKRIEQLQSWKKERPVFVGLGLYQGDAIEQQLLKEYFAGLSQLMVQPVGQALETYLEEVNRHAGKLKPMRAAPTAEANAANSGKPGAAKFMAASPESVEDAYNALKTYLMLAQPEHRESGHLTDQITRFWREWLEANRGTTPYEQMIQGGERMITFAMTQVHNPDFPQLESNFGLVDATRSNLRQVVRGMPARERVYADIKARAATRYAPVTVNRYISEAERKVMAGSYIVSGAFTKEAWQSYVNAAFRDAATAELQNTDWVLKISTKDDLSLEGSPEKIRQTLTDMYKQEYVAEWKKFMQGITVNSFSNFDEAVQHMNMLGDEKTSPLRKIMQLLYEQTAWDNPSALNSQLATTQKGVLDWFKRTILRRAPSQVDINLNLQTPQAGVAMGPIGREFEGLTKIMSAKDNGQDMLTAYLQALGKIRTRLNQIKNQGDAGPAIKALVSATLEGNNSELVDGLRYVDEHMLVGQGDTLRVTLRPMLVRPLMQTFDALIAPTEMEVNRVWASQVYEPFRSNLARKYPFDAASKVEATEAEIRQVFGAEGAIAKFAGTTLGPLVTRRGSTLTARTWADMGIGLKPDFVAGFPQWVAYGGGSGAAAADAGGATSQAAGNQTVFQVLPVGSPDALEYTLEIDGQRLRYRNVAPAWVNFFWPNPSATPGVKLTAVTVDGRTIEIFNEPGRFGLDKLFESAKKRQLGGGVNELSWARDGVQVTVQLRVVSSPGQGGGGDQTPRAGGSSGLKGLRLPELVAAGAATVARGMPATAAMPAASGASATDRSTTAASAPAVSASSSR